MDKDAFQAHHRYAVTLRDESGKQRPVNLYVLRCYEDFMIVRRTDREGLLLKLSYGDVEKIVKCTAVSEAQQYLIPEAMLAKSAWSGRTQMQAYGSSPARGK